MSCNALKPSSCYLYSYRYIDQAAVLMRQVLHLMCPNLLDKLCTYFGVNTNEVAEHISVPKETETDQL